MTNTNTDSFPDFRFTSSSPTHHRIITNFASSSSSSHGIVVNYHQNPRKKRTKLMKMDDGSSTSPNPITTCPPIVVSKPKYTTKKPDPAAPKITRPCSECGKKFWSWKALFGHMRCHPERQWRGINPPPNFRRQVSPVKETTTTITTMTTTTTNNGDEEGETVLMTTDDYEAATCLLMMANGFCSGANASSDGTINSQQQQNENEGMNLNCKFECSSCKKVFGSHQALGGHRASHKNVKGCFAITKSTTDGCGGVGEFVDQEYYQGKENLLMVLGHQCSICLRVFSSGQALGGHKRRHWEQQQQQQPLLIMHNNNNQEQGFNLFAEKDLDLNLPPILPAPPVVVEDDSASSSHTSSSSLTLELRLGL